MFLNNKKARRCELTNLLTLNLIHMKNRFVIATSMRFYLMLLFILIPLILLIFWLYKTYGAAFVQGANLAF